MFFIKSNFRTGKRRPEFELVPDAVPNKLLKLKLVNDEQHSSVVIPDHDYFHDKDNDSTTSNDNNTLNNNDQDNNNIIEHPDHDYCHKEIVNNNTSSNNSTTANNKTADNNTNINNLRTIQNCERAIMHYLSLKQQNRTLKKEIKVLKSKKHEKSVVFKHLRAKTNPATAAMLVTGGRGKKLFSREDVAVAAVLKSMSRKTYKFLRKKKLLKLPCESTLSQWLQNFTLDTDGLQYNLLDILSAKNLSQADRELWLAFDEMAIRESYLYNSKTKTVLQPAKKLQCVMVRSLISGWKLPIYFSTDENMTIDILSEIIRALEERGFTVRGVSFDLGNKGFMSQSKFNEGKYYIPHPADPRRKFYLLPDPPHLIKLFRNHVFSKVTTSWTYSAS